MDHVNTFLTNTTVVLNSDSKRHLFYILSKANDIAHKYWIRYQEYAIDDNFIDDRDVLEKSLWVLENTYDEMDCSQSLEVMRALDRAFVLIIRDHKETIRAYDDAYAAITNDPIDVPF